MALKNKGVKFLMDNGIFSKLKWCLLFLFAIIVFTINLKEPGLYSTQEGNAGIIVRNMIDTGNYFSTYIKDAHNTEKPILSYLICLLSCMIFGVTETGLRFPSALAAVVTVMLAAFLAKKIYNEKVGLLSGFILATMLSFVNLGRIARIDIILCAFFMLAMVLLYKGYIEHNKPRYHLYFFYVVLAMTVLLKGPVCVVLAGLIVLLYAAKQKSWKILWEVKPVSGFIIGAAIACPWYVYESIRTNGEFAFDFLWNQNVTRFFGGTTYSDGQRKNILFYFPNLFFGALPWSLFLPTALYLTYKKYKQLSSQTVFLIIWVLAVFIFFTISFIKRGDYILPLYPALAILIARYIIHLSGSGKRASKLCWLIPLSGFLVFSAATILSVHSGFLRRFAVTALSDQTPYIGLGDAEFILTLCDTLEPHIITEVIITLLFLAVLYVCGKQFERGRILRGSYIIIGICFVMSILYFVQIQPALDKYRSEKDFSLEAAKHIDKKETIAYYKIWNLEVVFYVNRKYDKVWKDTEIIDYKTGLTKYNYFICPKSVYDIEDRRLKERLEVLATTIDRHQEPLVLCFIKKPESN